MKHCTKATSDTHFLRRRYEYLIVNAATIRIKLVFYIYVSADTNELVELLKIDIA